VRIALTTGWPSASEARFSDRDRHLLIKAAQKSSGLSRMRLAAAFPRSVTASVKDMTFAAAYDTLPGMMGHGAILANEYDYVERRRQ
jgi:hypothetical protein